MQGQDKMHEEDDMNASSHSLSNIGPVSLRLGPMNFFLPRENLLV